MEAAAAYKKCNINEHTKTDLSARQLLNYQQIVFLIGVPPSLKICRDNTAAELSRQESCYRGVTKFTQVSLRLHLDFATFVSGRMLYFGWQKGKRCSYQEMRWRRIALPGVPVKFRHVILPSAGMATPPHNPSLLYF